MADSAAPNIQPVKPAYDPITGVPSEFNQYLPKDCEEYKRCCSCFVIVPLLTRTMRCLSACLENLLHSTVVSLFRLSVTSFFWCPLTYGEFISTMHLEPLHQESQRVRRLLLSLLIH